MIQGCTSGAGKSLLVAGLCRAFSNRGEHVAPFKALNISNYAAVTSDGGEMSRAQWLQALAARVEPDVLMNPVLGKISSSYHGHVIVRGKPAGKITTSWDTYCEGILWPIIQESLRSILSQYERVVIEGAGSPAEVNLRRRDVSNMKVAIEAGADVFLVADIEKGGAFAHLLGTFLTLEENERKTVKGFVINRYAGDADQLRAGIDWLQLKTGVPTVAVIPAIDHHLPEEDTLKHHAARTLNGDAVEIALICYPDASNLDEFDPLRCENGVRVQIIREPEHLDGFGAVILPGSRNTVGSLRYLRQSGMAFQIANAARHDTLIFGVCGGMQMLGKFVHDPLGIESGDADGLGLLDVETTLEEAKTCRQVETHTIDGTPAKGYEIHHGRTHAGSYANAYLRDDLGWRQGNVIGVCVHGLFEETKFRGAFLESLGWKGVPLEWRSSIEADLTRIAEVVAETSLVKER
jgi:adenosylcobyric acid synthase